MRSITFATTHFNPCNYSPLADVYYQWLPTLGELAQHLKAYELVFDDDTQELEKSIVVRGTREKNLMWQKEALLNLALKDTDTEYFCWIDHDVIFHDKDWLSKATTALKEYDAVHCLDHSVLLGREGEVVSHRHWTPGYAWLSKTSYLKGRGGFFPYAIVGGGDSVWIRQDEHPAVKTLRRSGYGMPEAPRCGRLKSGITHLWHGDYGARQYLHRHKILREYNFHRNDVRLNRDGILEWATDKPLMHKAVRSFFENRTLTKEQE